MINSHIKKLLIEEKDGTRISTMKGLMFLIYKSHSSTEKLKPITMKSLSALENATPLPYVGSQFICLRPPRIILKIGSETLYIHNQNINN